MKIRTQFMMTKVLFGMILIIIVISAIITSQQVDKASEQEMIASSIAQGASELSYLANDYLIYRESQQLKRWESSYASFSSQVASLNVDRAEQQAFVRSIQANQQRLKQVFDSVVSAIGNTSPNQRLALDPAFLQVSWSRMAVQSQGLVSDASRLSQQLRAQENQLKRTNMMVSFMMISVFGAYFLINSLMIKRRILNSIVKLQAGSAVIGSGNLDFTLEEKKNDEIGDLSHAFNRMTASLKQVTASKADLEKEISERKHAEEELRQRTLELQHLTEALEQRVRERTEELEKANEALHHLSSRLISAHEEERKRIAGEIHDVIGASLSAIKFKVEGAVQQIEGKDPAVLTDSLKVVLPVIQEGIEECRRIQMDLRPPMLDDLGLLPTLSWFCRRFQAIYSDIRIEQEIKIEESAMPPPRKIVVFRVTQEAMNNIAKHSKADLVRLSLQKKGGQIRLTIQDNGQGFNLEKVISQESTKRGLGLSSMKERTELSGGSFATDSAEGKGTTIHASWPL
ncbi:MAG: HAMP domain-containing protein [Candidatus Tectomicrobia bacterium]|uniref:Oxygen sensor histidine kinase NreB n=1 Tax=Tectimicrobiota bacterium TaxID=2528274 RepID=A0A933GLK7_UNCTE|nr:HAMP domain-containing protein [Candidatus Tectomicrobia bacterium]